jgi:hypothetical protein
MMLGVPRLLCIAPRTVNIATSQPNKKSINPRPSTLSLNGMKGFYNRISNIFYGDRAAFNHCKIVQSSLVQKKLLAVSY